ncbi:hypothetical protein E2C01_102667 [Portunus trituberculatus]|uniref:Uncharacterized protein n=1 Tax=Portunus trituberculatus TaxID=210409 RepID=A0A5B7KJ09_PORTR|nr:hypothetical protein [Portunus trituberculatus]
MVVGRALDMDMLASSALVSLLSADEARGGEEECLADTFEAGQVKGKRQKKINLRRETKKREGHATSYE